MNAYFALLPRPWIVKPTPFVPSVGMYPALFALMPLFAIGLYRCCVDSFLAISAIACLSVVNVCLEPLAGLHHVMHLLHPTTRSHLPSL